MWHWNIEVHFGAALKDCKVSVLSLTNRYNLGQKNKETLISNVSGVTMRFTSLMTTLTEASSGTLTILSETMKLRERCCLRRHQGIAYHQAIRS